VPSEKRRGRPGNCYDLTTTLAVLVEWLKCWLPHQQGATDPRTKRILSQVAAYAMLGSAAETGEPPEVIHKLRQAVKPFLKPIPGFELPVLSAAELEILGRLK
jgi:hypothetical protein